MSGLDEVALSRLLERTFLPTVSDASAMVDVRCEPLDVGWYGAYRLNLRMEDDSRHLLFLKDFGTPRGPKEDLQGRRERERQAYELLLDSSRDGTAHYYGVEWDARAGRFWLLLEWVNGDPLRYQELEVWYRAAAWLARLHGTFRRDGVESHSHPWLRRHDADFFLGTLERAVDAVSVWSAEAGSRLKAELAPYGKQVRRLTAGPTTLVHGAFLPIQILVTSCDGGERLCPLDWELAAVGSPAYDLGFLAYGFGARDKAALLRAYAEEAERAGLEVPLDLAERVTLVEVHRTLDALSRCIDRAYDDEAIHEYLEILGGLWSGSTSRVTDRDSGDHPSAA